MTIQPQNNNLNYLIDPIFIKVNSLFVLPFERIRENNAQEILFHTITYQALK